MQMMRWCVQADDLVCMVKCQFANSYFIALMHACHWNVSLVRPRSVIDGGDEGVIMDAARMGGSGPVVRRMDG